MATSVEAYIAEKGWAVRAKEKVRGVENLILDCPLCHAETTKEKRRFWICNDTKGAWICNECQQSGGLYDLRKLCGDVKEVNRAFRPPDALDRKISEAVKPEPPDSLRNGNEVVERWHRALLADEGAMRWLTGTGPGERAIPVEVAQRFKLGLRFSGGQRWLTMPYFCGGNVVLVKYRCMEEKKFQRSPDCPSPLFNLDDLDGEWRRVYLTEGELDAVSLVAMGYSPVVSLPNGAKDIEDSHAAFLERFDEVYIVTDSGVPLDAKGEQSAKLIAERLGTFRCLRVRFPLKDANAMLHAGRQAEVKAAIASAASMCSVQPVTLIDLLDLALADKQPFDPGTSTGLVDLDRVIGGWRSPEWTVVGGDTGAGKSTLQNQFVARQVREQRPTFVACLELPPKTVAIRLASQVLGRSLHADKDDDSKLREARDELWRIGAPAFIVPKRGVVLLKELRGQIEYCVRRYGVRYCSVDHLDFILSDINDLDQIDQTIMAFDGMISDFDLHGWLAVHPKSVEHDKKRDGARRITLNDLRGSAKIKQLCWNAILLDKPDPKSGISIAYVEKMRWEGRNPKLPAKVPLKFNGRSLSYEQAEFPETEKKDYKKKAAGDKNDD